MSEAPLRALCCPNCGAPMPLESLHTGATCAFCGVSSAPDPAAAAPASAAARTMTASGLACPRCGGPLFDGQAGRATLHGCGRCGGVWLDNTSAQAALTAEGAAVAELARRASARAAFDADRAPPIDCPVCGRGLQRLQATKEMVWIDACSEHGTWFDRYELGLVLDASRPPPAQAAHQYTGPPPDFREGANPELKQVASIFATGTVALLAGLATAVAEAADD